MRLTARPRGGQPEKTRSIGARDLVGFLVSIVVVAAVVMWAAGQDTPTFPHSSKGIELLAVAVGVHVLVTLARGWRWHAVLRHSSVVHQPTDAYALTAVGYMGNTVLPARGGEVMRTVLLSQRSSARKREVLGSIIAERALDAAALAALLVVVTIGGIAGTPVGWAPAIGSVGAAALAAVALWIYLRGRRAGRWTSFAERVRPVVRSLRVMLSATGLLLLLISAGIWLADGVIFYLVGQSLDLSVSLPEAAFLVVISSFFALIPAAPGYVGTYDAAVLFGLKAIGVVGGVALSFTLLVRLITFGPVTLAGLVLLVVRYGGISRLRSRGAAE